MRILSNPETLIALVPSLLIALTFHEYAHARVAYAFGDTTAKDMGRMTLNPVSHLDPIGTLMILIVGFGWARPVPINPGRFRDIRRGLLWVSLAGPLANLFLIGVGLVFLTYEQLPQEWVAFFIKINMTLAAFNALPALPLDGGRIYRARLCGRLGFRRATQHAARLGGVFAVLFAVSGVVGLFLGYVNLTLIILGFFVYAAAAKEQKTAMYVLMRYLVRKQGELRRYGCLPAEHIVAVGTTAVGEVVKLFVPQRYHLIWVMNDTGEVDGLLSEYDVVHALVELGTATPVEQVLNRK